MDLIVLASSRLPNRAPRLGKTQNDVHNLVGGGGGYSITGLIYERDPSPINGVEGCRILFNLSSKTWLM